MASRPPVRRGTTLVSQGHPRKGKLRLVQGVEVAECGLACLVMIAEYHGHSLDMTSVRQTASISEAGSTLRSLMSLASSLRLSTRAVRLEIDDLTNLSLPAILHWDMTHFVVLKSVRRKAVVILDPAKGERTIDFADLGKHFTGVALEVFRADGFEPIVAKTSISLTSLWSKISGFWGALFLVVGLSAAIQALAFLMPFQLQLVIDEAILGSDIDILLVISLSFAAIVIIQNLTEALRGWTLQSTTLAMSFHITGNIVRHLLSLSGSYFSKRQVGDVMSRMRSAQSIQDIVTKGLVAGLIDSAMAIFAVVILFTYSATMAWVVLVSVAANLIISLATFPALRARMSDQLVSGAREQSHVMESIRASTTIKTMSGEAIREAHWRNLYSTVINSTASTGRIGIGLGLAQGLIMSLQSVAVIYIGARNIIDGDGLSVGMLVAFMSFRQTFTDRANSLVGQIMQMRAIGMHLERLSDIVLSPTEESPSGLTDAIGNLAAIRMDDVSFRYGATDPLVLNRISFSIEPGEFVGFTGASGAGKTTILRLILGLQQATEGTIYLGDTAATPATSRAWRSNVGTVLQEDQLLAGTIADNIAFFDPDLDMERVRSASEQACIASDIERMPMRYLSLVGDMGSALSSGQKQRLLLARAIYREPKVLILDEGTANIDAETEQRIADTIANMALTRIVVAHRPALLSRADRIYTLRDGVLEEVVMKSGKATN